MLRVERGLTLRDAEQLTGVDKDTLSKIERGRRHPHDVTLAKIAKGYGVPVEDLLEEPVPVGKGDAPKTGPEEEERRLRDSFADLIAIMDAASARWERAVAGGEVCGGPGAESAAIEGRLAEKMEEAKRDAAAAGLLDKRGRLPRRIVARVQTSYNRWWKATFAAEEAWMKTLEGPERERRALLRGFDPNETAAGLLAELREAG